MGFTFNVSVSDCATRLFQRFWEFLRLENALPPLGVGRGMGNHGRSDALGYSTRWSSQFDSFIADKDGDLVERVLSYYIEAYRAKKDHVLLGTPDAFFRSYGLLESRYQRRVASLSKKDFPELWSLFMRYRWSCDDETLEATIGRSLATLRRFKKGLASSDVPRHLRDYIRNRMGFNHIIIKDNYIPRSALPGSLQRLDKPPISLEYLYERCFCYLRDFGCRSTDRDSFLRSIRESVSRISE